MGDGGIYTSGLLKNINTNKQNINKLKKVGRGLDGKLRATVFRLRLVVSTPLQFLEMLSFRFGMEAPAGLGARNWGFHVCRSCRLIRIMRHKMRFEYTV